MAYKFTTHAVERCKERALEPKEVKKLFEKGCRVKLGSPARRLYKFNKYGEIQFEIEYYYSNGYVFVSRRINPDYSEVLTFFPCAKRFLIFYGKEKR